VCEFGGKFGGVGEERRGVERRGEERRGEERRGEERRLAGLTTGLIWGCDTACLINSRYRGKWLRS
jgi:hypothetical protein